MNILGIHIGHDSSVALVRDGRIVADVAEERFNRRKHFAGFPMQALTWALSEHKLTMEDIDIIAVPALGSVPELNYFFDLEGERREKSSSHQQVFEFAKRIMKRASAKPPLYIPRFPAGKNTRIVHVEHHLAHAASAYYTSGTPEKQLIVTIDGAGDGYSTCLWRGEGGKIEPLVKYPTSASIGWFYSNVTEALGWWHGDGEGKTMGLAPYGDPERVKGVLDGFYPRFADGKPSEFHDFDRPFVWHHGGAIQWHFDDAYEIHRLVEKHGREHIAAEAQRVLEEEVKQLIFPWLEREGTRNLSCAGGVFLNVKLNQRLWESDRIDRHHIFPNAGDSGLAVGAALHAWWATKPRTAFQPLEHLYWGPAYSASEIEEVLKLRNISYQRIDDIEEFTAQKLAENKIVAWFQGCMESGPRALGNRSILMSSNRAENKDIINARVKFREAFRPFCPSLLWEHRADYLQKPRDESWMITSFTCTEEKRSHIPAVVHEDHTLRPQTVRREVNERYWKLIKTFGDITGEQLLLNTSFNIMGEPIINHPREAIRCFYDNGLDYLVMDNFVLSK